MKKTLVAVAALAASAAFAQSSVTLYGVADAYIGSQKNAAGVTQSVVNSDGLSPSRVGVSVKEDLGSGLNAFANFEQGIKLDTGSSAGVRTSIVGLGGSFGSVSLGAQDTPLTNAVLDVVDAQGESGFSALTGSVNRDATTGNLASVNGTTSRLYTNSVRYDSPNMEGFSGAVQYGFGEDKTTTTSASHGAAFNLKYANGPVAVALAYQSDKAGATATTTNTTVFGGSYDFGPAKLNLGYGRTKVTAMNAARDYNIGVTIPVGAFSIVGQYANAKVSNTAGNSRSFGLEGRYALSKRTTAYVGYNDTRNTIGGIAAVKTNRFGVGLRHVF